MSASRIFPLCGFLLVAACEPNGLYSVQDGEAYIEGKVRPGLSMHEVERLLAESDIDFSEIRARECGDPGDTWMDPRCVCAGGPALWLELSENVRPYNPFYSPTMNAFLAFDDRQTLSSITVIILGGDD